MPCSSWDRRSILGVSTKAMGYGCWCFGNVLFSQNAFVRASGIILILLGEVSVY